MGIHPASGECRKSDKGFTITFHVDHYAKHVAKLKAKGVALDRTEDHEFGRFGWITDLEGKALEFWQAK